MKPEEIRSAIDDLSKEKLADILSIVLSDAKPSSQTVIGADRPELKNFAQAIIYLKKNYDFEELDYFFTEADLVYINKGDRRILLTDKDSVYEERKEDRKKENVLSEEGRFSQLEI